MRLNRRRFLTLTGSALTAVAASTALAACGEVEAVDPEEAGLQGWTEGQNVAGGTEVSTGQPGGFPDERAVLGLQAGRLVIASIEFAGEDSKVVIENRNTAQDTMFYWTVAANGDQWEIPGNFKLQPGETFTIGYGAGTDSETAVFMNGALGTPDPAAGEFALYNEAPDLTDWTDMHHYVQWGETGQQIEPVAIEGAIWEEDVAVDVGASNLITFEGTQPGQGQFVSS